MGKSEEPDGKKLEVCLIRHAKAEKEAENDFVRPLSEIGIREAQLIGQSLKRDKFIPDLIISSDSVRTFETGAIVGNYFGIKKRQIQLEHILYQGTRFASYYQLLQTLDDSIRRVVIVGHNTTLDSVATDMCPDFKTRMTTAAAVMFQSNENKWEDIKPGCFQFGFFKFNSQKKKLSKGEITYLKKIRKQFIEDSEDLINRINTKLTVYKNTPNGNLIKETIQKIIEESTIVTIDEISELRRL